MNTHSQTTALDLMMTLMPRLRRVIERVRVHDKNLAGQMKRSAESVISNHAEADGVRGGHRRERVQTAMGSLCELRGQLKLAIAWGHVDSRSAQALDAELDVVAATTWRRLHPRR